MTLRSRTSENLLVPGSVFFAFQRVRGEPTEAFRRNAQPHECVKKGLGIPNGKRINGRSIHLCPARPVAEAYKKRKNTEMFRNVDQNRQLEIDFVRDYIYNINVFLCLKQDSKYEVQYGVLVYQTDC